MIQWNEAQLDQYLQTWMRRNFRRKLIDRYFLATVTRVANLTSSKGQVYYLCTVEKFGETTTLGTGLSLIPGYVPAIGDLVECVWRDDAVFYVAYSLAGSAVPALVTTWNPSGGWPQSATFTLAKAGLVLVEYDATLFATAAGAFGGVQYSIDSVGANHFAVMFWNVASQHLSLPSCRDVFGTPAGTSPSNPALGTVLAAGVHTITLAISGASLSSDTNDRASVKISRLEPAATFA